MTWHDPDDKDRVIPARERVHNLLRDGGWHLGTEILAVGGTEGIRRARELREKKYGGFALEKRKATDGVWEYRLSPSVPVLGSPDLPHPDDVHAL